jgi:hypothetical protein
MKSNDAALIFFGQFESEKMVPVCRTLLDPDHRIKFCMIFSNMSKVGVKNKPGSCWAQHTHWDDRISLLETVVFFAKLFAQVEKIQGLFSYCRKVCTSVFCTGKRSNFDLVYCRKIYRALFLQRDTMFRDILSAEKHFNPSKSKL